MHLNPEQLEDSSVIYHLPQPAGSLRLLYYPICIGCFDCKPVYSVQRNSYNSYLLIVMLKGSLSYRTRRSSGVAHAGQALLIDCNAPHAYAAQGRCSFTFVHFDGAQSREICEEILQTGGGLIQPFSPNLLHESIGEMMNTMRQDRRMNESQTSAALYAILMQLLDASGASGKGRVGHSLIDEAIAYIQAHLAEPLTVERLAAHTGYSAGHFSQLFVKETGMPPYQFVVRCRVERAQLLLRTTRLSMQDIAFQTGFSSASGFCCAFRRFTGETPHEFRKRPV